MPNRSGLFILFGVLGVLACGGPADDNFSDPAGVSGKATTGGSSAGKSASGGKGGGSGAGGTSGSSSGGKGGGSGTSGSGAGGSTGGTGAETGGTGGSTGGTGGSTGGTGAETGGTDTGGTTGTGGSTGGSGSETGGTGALGGMGAMAGSGTGGDAGSSAGAGGSGGNAKCVEHARAYSEALEAARVCSADSGKEQCTKQVPGNLACGCAVFVNPDNEEAVAELERLMKELPDECIAVCPAVFCLEPDTDTCVAGIGSNDGNGTCGPVLVSK
jgi:hypothetical protein